MHNRQYSPSVNIIRDYNKELNYIVTPNAKQIAKSIASHFASTGHCFNIIGSYGTGKSSFIWALEQSLNKRHDFFYSDGGVFNDFEQYEFINLIGSYSSIIEGLAKKFKLNETSSQEVLKGIEKYCSKLEKQNKFIFIIIDEYGKFLEYAAKNKSEESIYFIQELAEFVNTPDRNVVLLTSLHQNFAQYGKGLNTQERNEWIKVNGRFIDLTFNEPVEQLLFLAREHIMQWNFSKSNLHPKINKAILDAKLIKNSSAFDLEFADKLFPLDLSSANSLTMALQSYGQNERSLFTFLNQKGFNSLYKHAEEGKWYHLGKVYDFIIENFYGFIISSSNPHKNGWDSIRIALEKVESTFNGDQEIAELVIKAIGLLNIFAPKGAKIDSKFILQYFSNFNSEIIESTLDELVKKQIIRFRSYSSRYILFEGTDLDFDIALEDAKKKVPKITDVASSIKKVYYLPYLLAKAVSYQIGTPRFFEYIISNIPLDKKPSGEVDGYINLIFSEQLTKNDIQKQSISDNAILYAFFERTAKIRKLLYLIARIDFVISENPDDIVATKELIKLKEATQNELTSEILTNLTTPNKGVNWFARGEKISIHSQKDLNIEISNTCKLVYSSTPVLKNELINKHKLSAAISTARKNYFKALINHSDKANIGFAESNYPAEKTIYLSLLKNTGLHKQNLDGQWGFAEPEEDSPFYDLWYKSMEILNRGKHDRLNVKVFYEELSEAPFKLKDGFLSFWVPTFLFINQDNFALFNKKGYVPFLTDEVVEILPKTYNEYSIKTFSVEGIKLNLLNTYRSLINKSTEGMGGRSIYIETIRPLFVFYRNLPEYTKFTKNISVEALNFREAIANASDPETAFFDEIPRALGYSGIDLKKESIDLDHYLKQLKDVIRELRECEQDLLFQLEMSIKKIIGTPKLSFEEYKANLEERFEKINIEIISPTNKRLLSRLLMPSNKKEEWIKGLFNSLFNKGFDSIRDEEIPVFINKFKHGFRALERLIELHRINASRPGQSVFSIDIINKKGDVKKENIILPKEFSNEYKKSESRLNELVSQLDADEQKALLLQKLQTLI